MAATVELEQVTAQACYLPVSTDGLPLIGEIKGSERGEGAYVAAGHSCWGILNAPATGKGIVELILVGRSTTVDLRPYAPSRFG